MKIIDKLLTHNRPYVKRPKTTAIAVHWVGNPNTTAEANRNYFQNTERSVSSNYIVGLNGEVICCIPDDEISWCTNQANGYTISIETCHPDTTGIFNNSTYNSLVELTAMLCKKYNLNPLGNGIIRHYDITKKVCPKWFVPSKNGGSDDNKNTNWNKFKGDVAKAMGNSSPTDTVSFLIKAASPDGFLNIRNQPNFTTSKVVGKINNSNTKYTIIEEKIVDGIKFGKLKSGAGWISLSEKYVKRV